MMRDKAGLDETGLDRTGLHKAAQAFITDPGAWADPRLAAPLIAPGLRPETAQRLFASPRLARRASRWLADAVGCGDPAALEPVDLALASASVTLLDSVALCAGAVWHAQRVRALVLGSDISLLCGRLGDATRNAALRHAPPALDGSHPSGRDDDAAALADAVERDGTRCMSAWLDALPHWARSRVCLKWPGVRELPAGANGPASAVRIVRALASEALLA
jgi:hypothetical protein